MTEPRLSIVMPCWNSAETVGRAIASVLQERDVALECIVVDDGSGDRTGDVLDEIARQDPRVVPVRAPTNEGVSNARNRGLAIARGTWLGFHDADDLMMPGGIAALMRPTEDPQVRAVIGQRIWTDGEQRWISAAYDIPDIREPGRKSIAANPGLLFYVSATGKVFHRSLVHDLRFAGRVLGDQPWTIRALLRAGDGIEVVGETVFEWHRPHPDHYVETITSAKKAYADRAAEAAVVARRAYAEVSDEVDTVIADDATRRRVKQAYFERLMRSDMGGPVRSAIDHRDPGTGQLYEAVGAFVASVPGPILASSDALVERILRPPARLWAAVTPDGRTAYWTMALPALHADPGIGERVTRSRAWRIAYRLAATLPRAVGPRLANGVLAISVALQRGRAGPAEAAPPSTDDVPPAPPLERS